MASINSVDVLVLMIISSFLAYQGSTTVHWFTCHLSCQGSDHSRIQHPVISHTTYTSRIQYPTPYHGSEATDIVHNGSCTTCVGSNCSGAAAAGHSSSRTDIQYANEIYDSDTTWIGSIAPDTTNLSNNGSGTAHDHHAVIQCESSST
jgi:hypothetical protein